MSKKERTIQFGQYYLTKRTGSENWYIAWYEKAKNSNRRTERKSLGTSDLEKAKLKLAEWVISHGRVGERSAESVALAEIFQRYFSQHAVHLPGKGRGVQRRNLEILTEAVGELPLADFKKARQQELVRELTDREYSIGYIKRIFSTGYAAIKWAFDNEEIDRMPPRLKLKDSPARTYSASPFELARFWDAINSDYLRMYFILALSTAARPSAIIELTKFQIDLKLNVIHLNQEGRAQNNKRRPSLPMTSIALEWVKWWDAAPLVSANRKTPLNNIFAPWRKCRREAGLPEEFTPHAIRHTIATEFRRQGVPKWEADGFGGWRSAGGQTSERYAHVDPEYLTNALAAIENLFSDIAEIAETSLYPTCAPVARQLAPQSTNLPMEFIDIPRKMVGARGFEPRTSTMSR